MTLKKINLLFVITKMELGGAQGQSLRILRGLDRDRFNLYLFTAREGILTGEIGAVDGVTVHLSSWLDRPVHPVKDLLAIVSLWLFIRKNAIDVVHTHSSKAGIIGRLAAWLAGVRRVIHTVHGWSFNDYQSPVVRGTYIWLERFCARLTVFICVVSEADRTRGAVNRIIPAGAYVLLRYGIDQQDFYTGADKLTVRKSLGFSAGDMVVGTIACFKPQKAPLDFIAVARQVSRVCPSVKFLMIGDGVLRDKTICAIREAGLERAVVLAGWRRDIPALLAAMDVFVLTSLWEGLPISVMEAMASGIPVAATDTGGIRDIIRSGDTGYLSDRADVGGMVKNVTALLASTELRTSMAKKARIVINDRVYSSAYMIGQMQKLYIKCLNI